MADSVYRYRILVEGRWHIAHQLECLGSVVSFPGGVRSRAPTANAFRSIYDPGNVPTDTNQNIPTFAKFPKHAALFFDGAIAASFVWCRRPLGGGGKSVCARNLHLAL